MPASFLVTKPSLDAVTDQYVLIRTHLSVCPALAANLKMKSHRKTKLGVNVPQGRSIISILV